MSKERFTVQFPEAVLNELRDEASKEGLTLSSHIRRIAIAHLRRGSGAMPATPNTLTSNRTAGK